jgi:hypothetical protein
LPLIVEVKPNQMVLKSVIARIPIWYRPAPAIQCGLQISTAVKAHGARPGMGAKRKVEISCPSTLSAPITAAKLWAVVESYIGVALSDLGKQLRFPSVGSA